MYLNSTISNTVAVATQSAINGESFSDASSDLVRNIIIGAISNIAAKEIGTTYKESDKTTLDRTIQLSSHAVLGCASGAAAGGDCASGAVAGVVGELVTEMAMEHLNNKTLEENYNQHDNPLLTESQFAKNKQIAIELAGLAGGFSAIFTGNAIGLDDSEVAENIYIGQRVGKNAGENNYLSPQEKGSLVKELKDCGDDSSCRSKVQTKYEKISDPRDEEFLRTQRDCLFKLDCAEYDKINQKLRLQITSEGKEYYNSLTNEQKSLEFAFLPSEKSIYHTHKVDQNSKLIEAVTGEEIGYKKYVHRIYGYEIVVDSQGKVVDNHLNIGTYNFYNPEIEGVEPNSLINGNWNHVKYDVLPYIINGNSPQDQTSAIQRIARGVYFKTMKDNKNEK